MKRITLIENGTVVELTDNELIQYKDIDIDKLNLKDIRTKGELINYLNIVKDEAKSIEIARDILLTKASVSIHNLTFADRYACYDAVGCSGYTNYVDGDDYKETIILEFKYRKNYSSDKFGTVILDSKKCRRLLDLYNSDKYKKRIFIVYVFNDNKVRLFEFSKHYNEYCNVTYDKVYNAQYRKSDIIKDKTIKKEIHYSNDLTRLLQ